MSNASPNRNKPKQEAALKRVSPGENARAPSPVVEATAVPTPSPQANSDLLDLKNRLHIRLMLCAFLMLALGYSIHRCFSLIFFYLQHGHQTSEGFLKWLCWVTIAQIAILLGVFVRAVWPKNKEGR